MDAKVKAMCAVLMLCACTTTSKAPPLPPRVVDTACDWVKPIYINAADKLSDATARAILAHDLAGQQNCGWSPVGH